MIRVSQRIVERDKAAERGSEDDRALYPEEIAQHPEIVCPLVEVPPLPRTLVAATIPPVVVVDDLSDLGKR